MKYDELMKRSIPLDERQSWWAVMFVWIGCMVSLPAILLGSEMVQGLNFIPFLISGLLGFSIVIIITILQGVQSSDTGLATSVVAIPTYSESGARGIFSLIISISLIGWFGIQNQVAGSSLQSIMSMLFNIDISLMTATILIGVIMTITAVYGFKMMEYLNYVSVPLMIFVIVAAFIKALKVNDISTLFTHVPVEKISFSNSIGMVIGSYIVGAVIAGDFTRYNKTRKDTLNSAAMGIIPVGILLMLVGASLAIFSGQRDITKILVSYIKYPMLAYIMLLLATWTTNVTNAYSAGIAIGNGLQLNEKNTKIATLVSGIVGTFLAVMGILDKFVFFLIVLTNLIIPISGVMIADYWIRYKGKADEFLRKEAQPKKAIMAWFIGCLPGMIALPEIGRYLPSVISENPLLLNTSSFIGVFISMFIYLYSTKKEKIEVVENTEI